MESGAPGVWEPYFVARIAQIVANKVKEAKKGQEGVQE
jgi:hypothetical protein